MCRSLVKKLKDCDIGVYATKSMRAPEFVQTQYKYIQYYMYVQMFSKHPGYFKCGHQEGDII